MNGWTPDQMQFWLTFAIITASITIFILVLAVAYLTYLLVHMTATRPQRSNLFPNKSSFSEAKSLPLDTELVAQFKLKLGNQVVSVMESNGKRYLQVDGELTESERLRMLVYLKSEGFMS